ncbi:beta galactosidase jelly roll domain-containing protein [Sphingomonas nostoxanthinifaciens]|nr:beta galactosidase jelly roll domain-containing protein [Sphingomonas nostoxanthinifaciens]
MAVAMALLVAAPAAAQGPAGSPTPTSPTLVAADLRPGTDLTGLWHYSVDPYRSGLAGFHGEPPNVTERRWAEVEVAAAMRRGDGALFEFDMDAAPVATLPASWLTHAPEMRYYQGLVWYQRHFDLKRTAGARQFLRFGAANYAARVYLNGQFVGAHEGGFTPFAFEVSKLARDGDNQITVAVDSQATEASVPPPVTDWENYGGITRDIRLIETPQTYVDDAWVRLGSDGRIVVDARLDGTAAAGAAVTLTVPGIGVSLAGRTDAEGRWHAVLAAPRRLVRWSPERPQLYDLTIAVGDDRWHDRIGFRTIERRGSQILLNGRPVFLRGISLHEEEFGVAPARAITPAAARALLTEAKEGLHANYVRLAHYPHGEATLRLADELGLMVWSEVPVYWRIAWDNPATLATARRMLAENIARDRNRAAIIIWSIANETPNSPARNVFLATLADDARRLDGTRLVGAALLTERGEAGGHPLMTMNDPLADHLDVMGINTYNGWYTADRLADVPDIAWRLPADKPLIFSELGADAKAGFHDLRAGPQKSSEEFQRDYYRATLAMAAKIPTLRGMSPWILKDFRSPRRQNQFEQGWNRKGLESETGQHKLAFDVLADFYGRRAAEDAGAR